MKSYLSEDTDEEICDDLIKLFDNDINAVYFGSQPHKRSTRNTDSRLTFETIGNNEFYQPSKNSTCGRPDHDLVQTVQSGSTSECAISPLCVKLVDCGKFPWYYKKYTQQIMHKLNLNESSDSEHDIDVESMVDDSDDCFIVEDLQDLTNKIVTDDQICINTVKSMELQLKVPKNKHRKGDYEIQRALSFKNSIKVDLKRNQGLIGMKITHKIAANTTLDKRTENENVVPEENAKQKSVMADEKFLKAADKTLCRIGTELIPITEEKESNSICQLNINDREKDLVGKPTPVKSPSFKNVTVQFDINKISEKLVNNLKTKKINDKSSEAKLICKLSNKTLLNNPAGKLKTLDEKELNVVNEKELSSIVTITEKLTKSSNTLTSHVKDVKKTNKYKNDQIKIKNSASHSSLIGLLVTNKSKDHTKEIKYRKQKRHRDDTQNKTTKLDKNPRKKIVKRKREPKSPILHCSIPKKSKPLQVPLKCNKTDINSNLPKESAKLQQIVDKLTHNNTSNLMQDTNQPKHVFPKMAPVTKLFEVHHEQPSQKESFMIQDETVSQFRNINAKSLNMSDKLLKNCNEVTKADLKTNNIHNTQIMSCANKTLNEENVLHDVYKHNVNKHTINAVSVTNPTPKTPIKNNKPTVSNSNVSTTAVVTPASGSNTVLSKQYAGFPTPQVSHFPIYNAVPSKMSSSNIPNNNINAPVHSRYASDITLKSNNHTNFPFNKYCKPPPLQTTAFQSPMIVLSHTQPQSRDAQPPYRICYPPPPLGRHHRYFPSSAKSVPDLFHPPQTHIGQQLSNSMQEFYKGCWLPQNLVPPPPPPTPPPPPPPPPVLSYSIPPRNSTVVNQSNYTSTPVIPNSQIATRQNSVNNQQTINSSIIGMNNDGFVKKINIAAMPVNKLNLKNGTVKAEQIKTFQVMSPVEHSEVVSTKTEMLTELEKLSFADENTDAFKRIHDESVINRRKMEDENTRNGSEVAIMSKEPDWFEHLKLTVNTRKNPIQTKPEEGYSPPILPIPTYQTVLDHVTSNLQTHNATPKFASCPVDPRSNLRNECKPMRKRDFVKSCKRKLNNGYNNNEDGRRKDDAKKISLEEYKKRTLKNYCKSEQYKKTGKEMYDISGKRPNIEFKYRKIVEYSTETDLGYDSDSTVVL